MQTADDSGRIKAPSGPSGNSMPAELQNALLGALVGGMAAGGPTASKANQAIVPLWRVRPAKKTERVNPGEFGDTKGGLPQRLTVDITPTGDVATPDFAASSFLDMPEKDRADFVKMAVASGLLPPDPTPTQVAEAWQRSVGFAADYNGARDQDKWISPWEAVQRMGLLNAAGQGGSYDPFKPRTQTQTTKKDFTRGADAEQVTRNLESLFASEMGRAPTEAERSMYQRLVQKAYEASPETSTTVTTPDAQGNSTSVTTQSGGIDMSATLLDKVRNDPEHAAFQAGSTYFEAAMRALGAIA